MSRSRRLPASVEKALLVGLGVVAVVAAMTPLAPGGGMVAPDLLYAVIVAWVIRRPAATPLWAVLALGLYGCAGSLARRPGLAFAAAAIGVQASLIMGYAQWGAIKEVALAAMAVGMSYERLIGRIVDSAVQRYRLDRPRAQTSEKPSQSLHVV